ncbi:Vitellogenin II precursor [Riemerella anatipestifer]|uniref:Vitellogenin II precursor n=1 Tax=Riemerella anatipestifer TaxID=34085 RepID=UPI001374B7BE|nr:Vitellogenin II precursor [Riemerella anatipestifer]MDY3337712.1 Vitellogenin II precursor [Riemerella anatipestifer]MDY3362535.1 Vitellogenin II precursor [Riemerella anatipestifer]
MKKIDYNFLKRKWAVRLALATSVSFLLTSCGAQMGGYTETDGVYYDPSKDVIPEGVVVNDRNNVGDYYDYSNDYRVVENSRQLQQNQNNKYQEWTDTPVQSDSDWGAFAGVERRYTGWGWNTPFWGTGFGWDPYWGGFGGWNSWNMGFGWSSGWGWNMGFGMGWGSGWNRWGWGNPYWGGRFGWNPYWGTGWGNPYWGGYGAWGNPYWGVAPRQYNYRRSGVDSITRYNNGGFNNPIYRNPNSNSNSGRNFGGFRDSGFGRGDNRINRNNSNNGYSMPQTRTLRRSEPNYNYQDRGMTPRTQSIPRNDGFRNNSGWGGGSNRSGGFGSGSSGGGMRSGGGFRTGGFR